GMPSFASPSLQHVIDQPRDEPVAEEVRLGYLARVGVAHAAVPDSIGIDRHRRPFAAAPHARRARDPDLALPPGVLDDPAQGIEQAQAPAIDAVGAGADEDVLRDRL